MWCDGGACGAGLSIDPENQGLRQGLAEAETAQSGGGGGGLGGMFGPEFMAKLAMVPCYPAPPPSLARGPPFPGGQLILIFPRLSVMSGRGERR